MRVRAVAIFFDVNLQKSHKGLLELIKEHEVKERDLILFINHKLTAFKAMMSNDLMIYFKTDRLILNDFLSLPEKFGGERLILTPDVKKELMHILKIKLQEVGT